jgi:hypothetical protein
MISLFIPLNQEDIETGTGFLGRAAMVDMPERGI